MRLFVAEKKVLAEAISDALDGKKSVKNSVIYSGNDDVIVWCSGHLLTLKEPESYDVKYKTWNIADLPIYFEDWKNAIPDENKARVKQIGELIKQADEVVNCGDVDEEGQLLVDEILRWFNYKGICKRLDTANTTVDALKKALLHMKDNKECEADGWSAYAREVADMTFGINFTRFFSKSYNAKLPVGRVMTPTLGLVVNRDKAIEEHQKVYYYIMNVKSDVLGKQIILKYIPDKKMNVADGEFEEGKFLKDDFLKKLASVFQGKHGQYTVSKEKVKEQPPLPFNLTELNNYCGKKWGYNPDKVMKITQALRDDYAAITYNRSDCQYLSTEHHMEAPQTIMAACSNLHIPSESFDSKIVSRCFNDAYITAHFAIIPTTQRFDIGKLTDEQLNVYKAICTFYLIQFLPVCEKEKTTVSAAAPAFEGKSVGKLEIAASKIVKAGFRELLQEEKTDENDQGIAVTELPQGVHEGVILNTEILKKETKPPQRYTQTSLFDDMTKISKYVDDPEIRRLLLEKDKEKKGENGSIGTSATRAEIIKKLINVGYLEEVKDKKKTVLISTAKGRKFYALLPDEIKKADTTAKWWVIQENIKNGEATYRDLTHGVVELIRNIMVTFHANTEDAAEFSFRSKPICKCPACGGDIVNGKFGAYCVNKCGFRLTFAFGKKLTEKQFVSLCSGKKTKITGIKKKSGEGTFDAYAIPDGIEDFQYESNGKSVTGKRLKLTMSFK